MTDRPAGVLPGLLQYLVQSAMGGFQEPFDRQGLLDMMLGGAPTPQADADGTGWLPPWVRSRSYDADGTGGLPPWVRPRSYGAVPDPRLVGLPPQLRAMAMRNPGALAHGVAGLGLSRPRPAQPMRMPMPLENLGLTNGS